MTSVMRWDVVKTLIKTINGYEKAVQMVEVGVFVGHLSKFVLEDPDLPHLRLIGVDPYIGTDGSFPGNYSLELDADVPYRMAQEVFSKHDGRAQLAPTTSIEIASHIPDNAVDIVFLDGCHLYSCIQEDLKLWLPKIRPGGILVGHDFSPQWPGVVRAVHEIRGNRPVMLGMDWTYWWVKE